MLICVTSRGQTVEDQMDERFGRCSYLLFIDADTGEVEAVKNPGLVVEHGAGIAAAQRVLDARAEVLITGHLGPNAEGMLSSGSLQAYQGRGGTVQSVMDAYRAGQLKQILPAVDGPAP